jgi:oligopeptide/dipeptide ABC transporter ATP-binding protein
MHKPSLKIPILEAQDISKSYDINYGSYFSIKKERLHVIKRLNLSINKGESIGIIGESGCGKSTLARILIGLETPDKGKIKIHNQDKSNLSSLEITKLIQYVFQNPIASLNPRLTIQDSLLTPIKSFFNYDYEKSIHLIYEALDSVGIQKNSLEKYPHEFSGGQAQRICIARALLAKPEILILDEPVSALDVSIQAQILELLFKIKKRFNLTYIFISHDLAVVKNFCDRVAVMYYGDIVENGDTNKIFKNPLHPYTNLLVEVSPTKNKKIQSDDFGELPNMTKPLDGCLFYARCKRRNKICYNKPPSQINKGGRFAACNFPL